MLVTQLVLIGVVSNADSLAETVQGAVEKLRQPEGEGFNGGGGGESGGGGSDRGRRRQVLGFQGTKGDSILSIMDDQALRPDAGKVYLSKTMEPTLMHGGDLSRGEAYSIRVVATLPDDARVENTSTQGVPQTTIIHTRTSVPVQVTNLYIRRRNEDGEFSVKVIEGEDRIREYLLPRRN
jgi:hypothetical protein